ncbi:LpxI family protein [Brytella acorum]|uniref:UDP-2,3-diacylglucosamine diphosphatase LpxI n=1 Tax=Brytella acorum TaxID=2959299 RepID=A0AA35XV65_9PROT|nr:UDP-2,3-diacylglucosamine diphosphatase LpxI [Brytella acorum]MDF3625548.1 UDP-2,3-diacylglucosamine diphosphatase LpxI [Brytella acorum]CAI9119415.1 UDP-2,3-diacylglucosamine diphosphatase LpxI [Brytella acorum]
MTASPVGVLAGGGPLPAQVAEAIEARGGHVFVIAFQDFADLSRLARWPHRVVRLAAAGEILSTLRKAGCRDLVLIGPVRRPALWDLRPDAEGARIMARIGRALFGGDDGLLGALVKVLGEEGFRIRGAHEFLDQSLGRPGAMGRVRPDAQALQDIRRGVAVIRALGALDIGQGCVVQDNLVLAVEALEGTDAMLARCHALKQPGPGGVLVKTLKPGQEARADMPTIGPVTIRNAAATGLRGVAFQAGSTLLTDPEACVRAADELGLFLFGIDAAQMGEREVASAST